jgi:hypothetical protein
MPTQATTQKAKRKVSQGYSPKTAAGEFVHEEMHHRRQRRHGSQTRRQAVAIGLSKARRAGLRIGKAPRSRHRPGTGASGVSRRGGRARRSTSSARRGARKSTRASSRRSR